MAWKEAGFSLWWSSVSSSEGPFGAVWEEQLDDAQHPGDLGSHPRPCPGWMHPWISAGSTSSSHSGPGTAGPGQSNKSIFRLISLNIEHCWACASFFPPSPNFFFFFIIFANKLLHLQKEIQFSDSTEGELSMTLIPICFSSPFKRLRPV